MRIKLNNKGFAITSIVYAILLLFILLVSSTLLLLSDRKLLLNKVKENIISKYGLTDDWTNPTIDIPFQKIVIPTNDAKFDYPVDYTKGIVVKDSNNALVNDITYKLADNYSRFVPGSYTITYTATDTKGLFSLKTSTVEVRREELTTYNYSGASQNISLAPGNYMFELWGAEGGAGYDNSTYQGKGGKGGYASGEISVKTPTNFIVYVGGIGTTGTSSTTYPGGFNGGGMGYYFAGGGGGASDIRTSSALSSRIIVAGGGGGGQAVSSNIAVGGIGGGGNMAGGNGTYHANWKVNNPGFGASVNGSPTAGMNSISNNTPDRLGTLGQGGGSTAYQYAAGGGGGFYGGSQGGFNGTTGGGGSGYIDLKIFTHATGKSGVKVGQGQIKIHKTAFYE